MLPNLQGAINGIMDWPGAGIGFMLDIYREFLTQILGELGQVVYTSKNSAESPLSFQNCLSAGIASLSKEGGNYATARGGAGIKPFLH